MAMAAATSLLAVGSTVGPSKVAISSPSPSAQTLESSRQGVLTLSSSFKECSPLRSCSSSFSDSSWSVTPSHLNRRGRHDFLPTRIMLPSQYPDGGSSQEWPKISARAIKSFSMFELDARKLKYPTSGTEALITGMLTEDGYRLTLRRQTLEPLCHLVLGAKDFNHLSCSYEKVGIRSNFMLSIAESLEEARGHVSWRQLRAKPRVSASLDADEGKTDGARKALEQMFQGKSNLSKKWEEEIKKRELGRDGSDGVGGGGGGGRGRGRGWGGGGGGGNDDMDESFSDQEEPWDWEEVGQTSMATFALIILYFSITHGPKQVFRLFRLFFRWVRQGFHLRAIPYEYLEGPDTDDEEDEDDSDEDSDDERLLNRETNVSASNALKSDVQNNHSPNDAVEEETTNEYSSPSTQYKKESMMEKMQAQQKEKMRQMLISKDRRGKEDK